MTDQELRELVRASIAQQMGGGQPRPQPREIATPPMVDVRLHASHAVYQIAREGEPCIIEPSVPCNHCNYCKSHGH
jgi:hypothetical protein